MICIRGDDCFNSPYRHRLSRRHATVQYWKTLVPPIDGLGLVVGSPVPRPDLGGNSKRQERKMVIVSID